MCAEERECGCKYTLMSFLPTPHSSPRGSECLFVFFAGFESILEGLFGPGLVKNATLLQGKDDTLFIQKTRIFYVLTETNIVKPSHRPGMMILKNQYVFHYLNDCRFCSYILITRA